MGLLDDAIREHLDLKRQRGADPGEIERLEREALGPVRRERAGHGTGAVPQLDLAADPAHDYEPATQLLQTEPPARQPKRGFLRRHRPAPSSQPEPSDFVGQLDSGHGEPHDDFEHGDPFGQDAFDHDDPFPYDQPAPHLDPLPHEHPAALDETATQGHSEPGPAAEPAPAEPVAGATPPHLIFDSAPPPRPVFAPVPSSTPPPEPALDDHARADAARETREWSVEEAFAEQDSESQAPTAEPAEEDVLEETPEFLQDTPDHDRLWFEQRPPRDFDFEG